ncbi:hypothetical protein M0811_00564 [Anaeramoeba ignava]|uniref:GPR180/TMEM145 transmembrane domain-containing protein n=1 Tax=Anaeramoeba ignava TaxID=1746090 RepID=A0A9Q0REM4_ANAIG|nr:hypothetical protein M0811_00564 [Anaeramoeba ignava]
MVEDFSIEMNQKVLQFYIFGFYENGTINMTISKSPTKSESHYVVCPFSLLKNLGQLSEDDFCSNNNNNGESGNILGCYLDIPFNDTFTNFTIIPNKDHYFFFITNCAKDETNFQFDFTLMNPNGQHLSSDYVLFPKIYLVSLFISLILFIAWIFNWIKHKKQKIPLHSVITTMFFLQVINLAFNLNYWRTLSKYGKIETNFQLLISTVEVLSQFFFFVTIILIAKGWCITFETLNPSDRKIINGLIGFLVIILQLLKIVSSRFEILYLFGCVVFYYILLRTTFDAISSNKRILKIHLILIRDEGIDPLSTPVYSKYLLFKKFKHLLFGFFFLEFNGIFTITFLLFYPWITQIMLLLAELLMLVGIGFIFRLRNLDPIFQRIQEIDQENPSNLRLTGGDDIISGELEAPNLSKWEYGNPLPKSKLDINPSVLLIENPNLSENEIIEIAFQEDKEQENIKFEKI